MLTGVPPAQKVVGIITRADLLRTFHEDVLAAAMVAILQHTNPHPVPAS